MTICAICVPVEQGSMLIGKIKQKIIDSVGIHHTPARRRFDGEMWIISVLVPDF